MCIVSNVTDHYRDKWPIDTKPFQLDLVTITREQYNEYLRLKAMALELDEKLKQPDCVKPEVEEWERLMEEFLKKRGIL